MNKMEQALDALVETEGVSRQEVIRRSILDRYERTVHARRVAGTHEPAECALGGRARPARAVVSETEYLDLEDVLSMVRALGIGPVRDLGLLDSAVAAAACQRIRTGRLPDDRAEGGPRSCTPWRVTSSRGREQAALLAGGRRLPRPQRLRGDPKRRGGLPTRDGRSLRRNRVGRDRSPSSGLKHVPERQPILWCFRTAYSWGSAPPGTSRCRRVDLERVGGPTRNLTPRPLEADSGWSELRQVA